MTISGFRTGVVGQSGGVGRMDIWRHFGVGRQTDTVFMEEDGDITHYQQWE